MNNHLEWSIQTDLLTVDRSIQTDLWTGPFRLTCSLSQGARQKHADEGSYGAISLDPVLDNHPALLQLAKDD